MILNISFISLHKKNMKTEIWKDIIGYEGLYMISDFGNVKSVKRTFNRNGFNIAVNGRVLKNSVIKTGYSIVILRKNNTPKTFTNHRLVAKHFLHFIPELDVNHKNGIKTDNNLSNLEMVTRSENLIHRFKVLGHKGFWSGKLNTPASKKVNQLDIKTNKKLNTFLSCAEAMRSNNFHTSSAKNIADCANGRQKTAYGYRWEYEEATLSFED